MVVALLFRESIEKCADAFPGLLYGPGIDLSQKRLEFSEYLFDRIETGAVWRQEYPPRAGGSNGAAHSLAFVAAAVVQHHAVARLKGWDEALFDPRKKANPVDRPVKDERRAEPIANAAGLPISRQRAVHRMAVDAPTQKCVAALRRLMPERTAATIRSRKSLEYGRPIEAGLHPCRHLEPVAFGSDCVGTKIVFFASSGDLSGVQYPFVLTNVVSVGGT